MLVYSYTEDPHFKDCFYWGEIKTVPMTELIKIDPSLTNEDLNEIAKYTVNHGIIILIHLSFMKTVCFIEIQLHYCILIIKPLILLFIKEKNLQMATYKIVEKDDQFNPPQEMMEEGKFEKVEKKN